MSSNSYQELDYFIFCVTDDNYIENTYVTLHSFYQFNDLPVTVFVLGNKTDRFNEFAKVTVKYLELDFNTKHPFYANIKPVIAKLKIFDDSNHQYNLSFDTDTLFTGSISDTLKEYQGTFIGVDEHEKHEINAGFINLRQYAINNNNFLCTLLIDARKSLMIQYYYMKPWTAEASA